MPRYMPLQFCRGNPQVGCPDICRYSFVGAIPPWLPRYMPLQFCRGNPQVGCPDICCYSFVGAIPPWLPRYMLLQFSRGNPPVVAPIYAATVLKVLLAPVELAFALPLVLPGLDGGSRSFPVIFPGGLKSPKFFLLHLALAVCPVILVQFHN